ncbi:hypothetical protein AB0M20_01170 [Actinoplanes sp. NPDC051633]|uniref:hypothetical protein n=1 Tax=Actinoplanes sp. NPDC051633 TaxID=3155670 RepID=UPI0034186FC6
MLVLVLGAAAAALWLFVTVLLVRAGLRTAARVGRRLRTLPLPTPAQATAGSLAGTALLGISAVHAAPTETAPTAAATAESPDHSAEEPIDDADFAGRTAQNRGVDLPDGGWIPASVARDVAAMVSLFWLRRRQTYNPATRHRQPAAPPPETATLIAARAQPLTDADPGPLASDQLPTGTVTLTGPGAHAAARGLIVTSLLATGTRAAPDVIISDADFTTLFGAATRPARTLPGLVLSTDDELEESKPPDSDTGPGRPLSPPRALRVSSQPSPDDPATDAVRTTIVIGAPATDGVTWHVEGDGTIDKQTDPVGTRLCVLSSQTAADLLDVIAHARGPALVQPRHADDPVHEPPSAPAAANGPVAPAAMLGARLCVLGRCTLTVGNVQVSIRRTAAWQVLVLLAVHRNGATSGQLTAHIWPGLPPASIARRLYTTISDLKRDLRATLPDDLILRTGDRYTLNPAIVDVDLWHLRDAAATAEHSAITTERLAAHRAVLRRHTGELADGQTWNWLTAAREPTRDAALTAYIELARHTTPKEAIQLLQAAAAVDPLNQHVRDLTIEALTELGDHPAADRLIYAAQTERHDRPTNDDPHAE